MKDYIYSEQQPLFGHRDVIGFGSDDFYIQEVPRDLANKIIIENHYSGKIYAASYIHLGVYQFGDLEGVLQFGYAMNPSSQGKVVDKTKQTDYLELNRMWLSDDCPRNSESRAISYSIKYIKRKYPNIEWVQSFADERCKRFGVVYQAANFKYFGEHTATFWELDGVIYHNSLMTRDPKLSVAAAKLQHGKDEAISYNLRQFRYLYFVHKNAQNRCLLKEQEYPKHESLAN